MAAEKTPHNTASGIVFDQMSLDLGASHRVGYPRAELAPGQPAARGVTSRRGPLANARRDKVEHFEQLAVPAELEAQLNGPQSLSFAVRREGTLDKQSRASTDEPAAVDASPSPESAAPSAFVEAAAVLSPGVTGALLSATPDWVFAQASVGATSDTVPSGPSSVFGGATPGLGSLFGVLGGLGLIAGGGGGTSAGAAAKPVVATNIEVINGYISGAKVWQDKNNNGKIDADETQGTTDAQGKVSIVIDPAGGPIRTEGGTDLSTGRAVTNSFSSPANGSVVSPITTIIEAAVSSGASLSSAVASVKKAFGIETTTDLLNFDPIEIALAGGTASEQAMKIKAAAVQISNTLDLGASLLGGAGATGETSGLVASALAKLVTSGGGTPVNLASSDTLGAVLNQAVTSSSLPAVERSKAQAAVNTAAFVAANANAMVADAAKSPDSKEALSLIARAQRIAQVEASEALGQAIKTGSSLADVISGFTGTGFANKASLVTDGVISPGVAALPVTLLPVGVKPPTGSDIPVIEIPKIATLSPVGAAQLSGITSGGAAKISVAFSVAPSALGAANFELGSGLTVGAIEKITETRYILTVNATADTLGARTVKLAAGWGGEGSPAQEISLKVNPPFSAINFSEPGAHVEQFQGGIADIYKLPDGNAVMRFIKPLSAKPYAGVTVALTAADTLGTIDVSSNDAKVGMWVFAPQADLPVRLQLASSDAGKAHLHLDSSKQLVLDDQKFVETEARTTKAGWQWMEFDFNAPVKRWVGVYEREVQVKLDPAVRYDQISVFPDFNATPTGSTFYFDGLTRKGSVPAMPADPPSNFAGLNFQGDSSLYGLTGFGGLTASLAADPEDASNTVAKIVKGDSPEPWAGVTLSSLPGTALAIPEIPFAKGTIVTASVYTPAAGTKVRLKVEDASDNSVHVETESVSKYGGWETLYFDFSKPVAGTPALDLESSYNKLSAFFDFGVTESKGKTYLIDDIRFVGAERAAPGNPVPSGYELVFEDNFDGTSLNTSKWTPDLGDGSLKGIPGWGNGEQQYYTADSDNVFVSGGSLHIVAKANDTASNSTYKVNPVTQQVIPFTSGITSARITTSGWGLDPYGYVEVRAKLPSEQGAWPAIWMLGSQGTWPNSGEIDIVEWSGKYFNDTTVQAALHNAVDHGNTTLKQSASLDSVVDRFHTYQMWWSPTEIRFGVDGDYDTAYYTYAKQAGWDVSRWPYDSPFYLLLNVAVGGTLGGDGFAESLAKAPYEMVVDHVRVYQGSAGGMGSTGPITPTRLQSDVISLFSNAYTNRAVPVWSASWDQATVSDVNFGGSAAKRYTNLSYAGIEFIESARIDASEMTHLHLDVFKENPNSKFNVKLVDFGANGSPGGGDDLEHEVSFNASSIPGQQWVGLDIALNSFAGLTRRNNLSQMIISGGNGSDTVYLDNIYFYKRAATDVISLFSDSYTNRSVSTWSAAWDQADVAEVSFGGSTVKKYTNFNFAGIELTGAGQVNASEMTHLHLKVYKESTTATFKIKLVDFGANGTYQGGDDVEHEITFSANSLASGRWVELDIALNDFTNLLTRRNLSQIVIGGGSGADTLYLDDIYLFRQAAPTPTRRASDVISLFSDAYANRTVQTWSAEWDQATVAEADFGGSLTKKYTNLSYAGIEFTGANRIDASQMTHLHLDVFKVKPNSVFKIKLVDFGANGVYGGGDDVEHELVYNSGNGTPSLAGGKWVGLDIALSDFAGLTTRSSLSQMIISGDGSDTVYLDNIYFHRQMPPVPNRAAGDVISLFSNSYTNRAVQTWSADWDEADLTDVSFAGNQVKKYSNLGFAGIEFTNANRIDASQMTHLHLDIFKERADTVFKVKLVDFGAGGVYGGDNDSEHEITFSPGAIGASQWVSLDIPLTEFSGLSARGNLSQMILVGGGVSDSVYLDNIYFFKQLAPVPTRAQADVISLFSDAYTNRTVQTWSAEWDRADVADVTFGGSGAKKYTNLTFAGIEFTGSNQIDATQMSHLHLDIFKENASSVFKIKLVDFGADGAYGGGDDREHEVAYNGGGSTPAIAGGQWVGLDIALNSLTGLTTRGHLSQMILVGGGSNDTVYLDNIYFYKQAASTPVI